jgi:hypothetical protein
VDFAPLALPPFQFAVVDHDTLQIVNDLAWTTTADTMSRQARRATGLTGDTAATNPLKSHKLFYLQVSRPTLGFTGKVFISHATNLTYVVPLAIRIEQENDDSAHDELRLYMEVGVTTFYQSINQENVHVYASSFYPLPEIDELEDGGQPWPAKSLGIRKYSTEMALLLIEDDDEDSTPESGDYLLAQPLSGNPYATSGRFAMTTLPLDRQYEQIRWRWSDIDPPGDANDTSYLYEMDLRLSHVPPCQLWHDIPGCN